MAAYPDHLAREARLADGRRVTIRPVRPEDEPGKRAFFAALSQETKRLRFHAFAQPLNETLVHFYTHIDYDRHMAFVCAHGERLVGEARYLANPDGRSCEFGVVVADDWRGSGIARLLMDALIDAARERGFDSMEGLVLRDNPRMLGFVRKLGFEVQAPTLDGSMVRIRRKLHPAAPPG
jgi:acetyltransferase